MLRSADVVSLYIIPVMGFFVFFSCTPSKVLSETFKLKVTSYSLL